MSRVVLNGLFGVVLVFTGMNSVRAGENIATAEPLDWQVWSPRVFEQAGQQGRLVLLDLTAKWCTFCRKMKEVTYRDPQVVATILRDFVPVRADEEEYPALARRYKKFGRPTTVIFNGKGVEIHKRAGYVRPQWMVWLLQAIAKNPSPEAHQ